MTLSIIIFDPRTGTLRASLGLLAQKARDAIIFLSALVASLYLERSRFLISVLLSFPHFVLSCVGSVDYKISVSLFLVFRSQEVFIAQATGQARLD